MIVIALRRLMGLLLRPRIADQAGQGRASQQKQPAHVRFWVNRDGAKRQQLRPMSGSKADIDEYSAP
jgi:hypothetical protein